MKTFQNYIFCFLFIFSITPLALQLSENAVERIIKYEPEEITDDKLALLAHKLSNVNHMMKTSKKILIPRIVGTPGHDKVRDFIISSMRQYDWHVEIDSFYDNTPTHGKLKFENIITKLNLNATRYLVLACHYDSKYIPNKEFIGAIDSAIPCAMLINLAAVMHNYLKTVRDNTDISLMFIFFDGEEAFKEWNSKDSIYGARHLSKKWQKEKFVNKIDILILLDLIGAPDPAFYSFFKNTEKWFMKLVNIEKKLSDKHLLNRYTTSGVTSNRPNQYFQPYSANSYIEDDHTPFLNLGVPVLHLITTPFPDFWHTEGDNESIIDYNTVENLNKILRLFVGEYLNIKLK